MCVAEMLEKSVSNMNRTVRNFYIDGIITIFNIEQWAINHFESCIQKLSMMNVHLSNKVPAHSHNLATVVLW